MTEQEWLASNDPESMRRVSVPLRTPRKWRLFCCACCKDVWHLLIDQRSRDAVDAAEKFADGLVHGRTLQKAYLAANCVQQQVEADDTPLPQTHATVQAALVADKIPCHVGWPFAGPDENRHVRNRNQAHLLRDIFGNPFRPMSFEPSWLTSTVVGLAQTIYDERAFDRLPILADALEEGDCTNADLLAHCRGPGPHVRGCWVVDLLLGKE